MFNALKRATLSVALLWLAGCAGQPEIPFDRTSAPDIKAIGIVTPSLRDEAHVVLASDVGQSFGLVGALIDASMQDNRDSKFNALLIAGNYSVSDTFTRDLTAALQQQGYAVTAVPVGRPESDYLKQYPAPAATKIDAYLDVVSFGYGYIAAGIGSDSPYRPFFTVKCRLVRASDSSVLMEDTVDYNPVNLRDFQKVVIISPDPQYQFAKFDMLTADPHKALAGLNDAVGQTTGTVAKLLH
jgi:hypothetical protein